MFFVLSLNVYLFHCFVYFGLRLLVYVTLQPHTASCALCSPSASLLATPVLHLVFGTHYHYTLVRSTQFKSKLQPFAYEL